MSIFSYAYSVPFPKDSKITWSQAFEALRYKARAPMAFVPAIASAEVLEENPTYIKRKTGMKSGVEMIEDINLYAPSSATFKSDTGQLVTNLISENAEGARFLTFTFYMPFPDVEPGSEAEVTKKRKMEGACKGAVAQSLKAMLEMFEEGRLN
ncbi:kinase domain protein [Rhizoctonia solani AG-3 Rhs1AP]|uniref:Kinase domain protein n=1 Tax=Rhizoctonia solani AG-3 Rhs1AP TaxID=1086054 RepID=X8JLL3_9AGAM|nr:kinase domain protein [Rhizoctonia solani AG-3 Rhs1AP]